MSGKHCVGKVIGNHFVPKDTKAFSEGLYYRYSGTAAQRPVTDNPHNPGDVFDAWVNGWNLANSNAGSAVPQSDAPCVAIPAGNVPL